MGCGPSGFDKRLDEAIKDKLAKSLNKMKVGKPEVKPIFKLFESIDKDQSGESTSADL